MRRVVTLINQVAISTETGASLLEQADKANEAAKKYQEDNLTLRQAFLDEDKTNTTQKQILKNEADKLLKELKIADDAVKKSKADVEAMRSQSMGLQQEYDRLVEEHERLLEVLQVSLGGDEDKKDQ